MNSARIQRIWRFLLRRSKLTPAAWISCLFLLNLRSLKQPRWGNESEVLWKRDADLTSKHRVDDWNLTVTTGPLPYSQVHCVQASSPMYPNFMGRSCEFRHLYYRNQTFYYFQSPHDPEPTRMTTALSYIPRKLTIRKARAHKPQWKKRLGWQPTLWNTTTTTRRVSKINDRLTILLYHPSYSHNFGHLLWDDLWSMYNLMDKFVDPATSSTVLPLWVEFPGDDDLGADPFYRCRPIFVERWPLCNSMMQRLHTSLLHTSQVLRTGTFLPNITQDYIYLPRVLVGSGQSAHYACHGDCTLAQAGRIRGFRNWMLDQLDLPPSSDSPTYITFSLSVNHSRPITFFEDLIPAVQAQYGTERVRVVNLASMTIRQQAALLRASKVYISYQGGGTASSVFLGDGAVCLLYKSADDHQLRDSWWYKSVGHHQTHWMNDPSNATELLLMLDYALTSW